ncbi:MAG: DNA/RNA non-specific endonuclease [Prolixibacteraceae bacterium]
MANGNLEFYADFEGNWRRMKYFDLFIKVILFFSYSGSSGSEPVNPPPAESIAAAAIVRHSYYTLAYSEENEQALWVYYRLTTDFITGSVKRKDNFRSDPDVRTGSASLADYKNSGYDRGHLCPAADMKLNAMAMSETFYMSNMSPQVPGFNRGIWSQVEDQVRKWVLAYDSLYIVTGPVFRDNLGVIGQNRVTVPGYYYKVIYSPGKEKMIGLVLPNKASSAAISRFVVPVDSVESLTGIDFFPELADGSENKLERRADISDWMNARSTNRMASVSTTTHENHPAIRVQCNGIAKSTRKRCGTMTTNTNGYCNAHQAQVAPVKKAGRL